MDNRASELIIPENYRDIVSNKDEIDFIIADSLSDNIELADELIQDVLISEGASVIYGDSNSGKTFFVIDMACAIALGINWMNKHVEEGLVVYIAAESPASVKLRLQAYQKHHQVRLSNFFVIQSAINLFTDVRHTSQIIEMVKVIESGCDKKVRLIIGDTLSRLIVGANENAGLDMGTVIGHIDLIRKETKAHFCLVHHSGKALAAGARGWSGLRAAVDTEIEIIDTNGERYADIKKQRELPTKGMRIGFKLEPIPIGISKWKVPVSSCIVRSSEVSPPQKIIKFGPLAGAILEYIHILNKSVTKAEINEHFRSRHNRTSIYNVINKLIEKGLLIERDGIINLSPVSPVVTSVH